MDKCDDTRDFHIQKRKINDLLVQQKVAQVLDETLEYPYGFIEVQKKELLLMAYTSILMHLHNKVICEVQSAKIAKAL